MKKMSLTPNPEVAAYRRNLVGGSPSISIAMTDETIARRLLERFHSKSILEKNGKWLEMALGKGRFQRIFAQIQDNLPSAEQNTASPLPIEDKPQSSQPVFLSGTIAETLTINKSKVYRVTANVNEQQIEDFVPAYPRYTPQQNRLWCSYYEGHLHLDEYAIYKNTPLFITGKQYLFTVSSFKQTKNGGYVYQLEDRYGNSQEVSSNVRASEGDTVVCTFTGFRKNARHTRSLMLQDMERFIQKEALQNDDKGNKGVKYYTRPQASEYTRKYSGHDYHLYCNEFTCCCCGRSFGTRQGYRMDLTDDVFCKECMDDLFRKKKKPNAPKKQWVHVIYTNMGHKK